MPLLGYECFASGVLPDNMCSGMYALMDFSVLIQNGAAGFLLSQRTAQGKANRKSLLLQDESSEHKGKDCPFWNTSKQARSNQVQRNKQGSNGEE